jgi:hypothetical protein
MSAAGDCFSSFCEFRSFGHDMTDCQDASQDIFMLVHDWEQEGYLRKRYPL